MTPMSPSLNLVFCGTPQFAVPTLEKLIESGFRINLVVTQPDRPKGRRPRTRPFARQTVSSKTESSSHPARQNQEQQEFRIATHRPQTGRHHRRRLRPPHSRNGCSTFRHSVTSTCTPHFFRNIVAPPRFNGPSRTAKLSPESPPCTSMPASIPATFSSSANLQSCPTIPVKRFLLASQRSVLISSSKLYTVCNKVRFIRARKTLPTQPSHQS